jgi:tellurite resistance protein
MHEHNMAILKSLVSVAWADGHFAEKEREMVDALITAFDASEEQAKEVRDYAAEKKTLSDMPVDDLSLDDRRVLLQHAVLLTWVDGEQHDDEKKVIDELCGQLGLPESETAELVKHANERAKRFLKLL